MTARAVGSRQTEEIEIDRLIDEAIVSPTMSQEAIVDTEPPAPLNPAPALLKQWILRTLADAYEPRPPIEYIIDGIFMLPSLNIVYGAPGSLKSMILADACVCVASGQTWLAPLPGQAGQAISTKQAPVFWLDCDNGVLRTDERFGAMGRARNLSKDAPLHYVSMPTPWLSAKDRKLVEQVAEFIKHLGAKLVVIDNLGLISGAVNENESGMAEVMGNLRWLCEDTGAAVVVIHHQRKSNGQKNLGRKGDNLRGHGSIEAALDLALAVERVEGTDKVNVTATKERGPTVRPISAVFGYRHKDGTKELERACFYASDEQVLSAEQRLDQAILAELGNGQALNKTKLTEAVKATTSAGVNRIRDRIDDLVKSGQLKEEKGKSTEVFYAKA